MNACMDSKLISQMFLKDSKIIQILFDIVDQEEISKNTLETVG